VSKQQDLARLAASGALFIALSVAASACGGTTTARISVHTGTKRVARAAHDLHVTHVMHVTSIASRSVRTAQAPAAPAALHIVTTASRATAPAATPKTQPATPPTSVPKPKAHTKPHAMPHSQPAPSHTTAQRLSTEIISRACGCITVSSIPR